MRVKNFLKEKGARACHQENKVREMVKEPKGVISRRSREEGRQGAEEVSRFTGFQKLGEGETRKAAVLFPNQVFGGGFC